MIRDALTLVVQTTPSRSNLLRRTLTHLRNERIDCPIIITANTAEESFGRTTDLVREFPELDITTIRHDFDALYNVRTLDCLRMAKTRYAVLHADDDFMFRGAMEAVVRFLDEHPDHAACQGRSVTIARSTEDAPRVPYRLGGYPLWNRLDDDPAQRLFAHLSTFCHTFYAVHRRDQMVENFAHSVRYSTDMIYFQYLPSCITALQGKIAVIDEFYYIRERHPHSLSAELTTRRNKQHWPYLFVSDSYSDDLRVFRDGVFSFYEAHIGPVTPSFRDGFDDACLWMFRRALCGQTRDEVEPADLAFVRRLDPPDTPESTSLRYAIHLARDFHERFPYPERPAQGGSV